jgi:hypothetical protein
MKHFDEIILREPDKSGIEQIPHFRHICEVYEKNGGAYTLLSPDGVVAISGVFPLWPGVGSAWSLTSDLVKKYPKSYYKATKQFLEAIISDWNLHRVQASTLAENGIACNWLRHLGFEVEGTMKKYGPDRADHIMFARVNQWTQ